MIQRVVPIPQQRRPIITRRPGTFGNTNQLLDWYFKLNPRQIIPSSLTQYHQQSEIELKKITMKNRETIISLTSLDLKHLNQIRNQNQKIFRKMQQDRSHQCTFCQVSQNMLKACIQWLDKLSDLSYVWPVITEERIQQLSKNSDRFQNNMYMKLFTNNFKIITNKFERQLKQLKRQIQDLNQRKLMQETNFQKILTDQIERAKYQEKKEVDQATKKYKQKLIQKEKMIEATREFMNQQIQKMNIINGKLIQENTNLKLDIKLLKI